MKTNNAMIFDLDGTLTNTLPLAIAGTREAVKKVTGQILSDDAIVKYFGKTEEAVFRGYCGDKWQEGVDEYRKYFEDNVSPEIVFDGIFDALNYLQENNIKTALVTGRGGSTSAILDRTGLAKYFEIVKTGSPLGNIKTECMKEVLGVWRQDPKLTYYIGDIAHDVQDAKAAGINPLSAAWFPYADKASLQAVNPLHIFDTVADFTNWLKAN